MKIAFDISPLRTGHKVRGVGFYIENLKNALKLYCPQHSYFFFAKKDEMPDDIDLIHIPYMDPFFLTLPLKKRKKTIVTIHDLIPLLFPNHFPPGFAGSLKWAMQKLLIKQIDAIITDSFCSKKDVAKLISYNERKIYPVHLAAQNDFKKISIDRRDKLEFLKKFNLPESFALYVGDITWNKNVPRLTHAARRIKVPLVIVGSNIADKNFDKSNPWNKDRVLFHKLIENDQSIHQLGFVSTEHLALLYNLASVFVFPSFYEGFGLPVLEAMSCGCPVITTKEGSLPEVCGEAAYFVDPSSIEKISEAIKTVFFDQKIKTDLSKRGLERSKEFSWEKTAKETVKVYEKVYADDNFFR